ncbi:hypothetical protein [Streptomyces bobili]|uniref:hypothetical protein n=1 Tax=Streptomyces bobili TaxID=67280 RepID=UPI003810ED24
MSDSRLGLDAAAYVRYIPGLDAVAGLGLNTEHGPGQWATNFGLHYLYSLGHTGHEYVAACVIAGLPPEQYPIALVDEQGPSVQVFASSITSWLPSFVLLNAERWLATEVQSRGRPWRTEWLEQEVDAFLDGQAELRRALKGFATSGIDEALNQITSALRTKDVLQLADWRPADLKSMIEPTGYVSRYRTLMASSSILTEWQSAIQAWPFYNRPLFSLFSKPGWDNSAANAGIQRTFVAQTQWQVYKEAPDFIPTSFAHEVFRRRTAHDTTGVYGTDLLKVSARLITKRHTAVDGPLAPLIHLLAENNTDNVLIGEAYFEAGQRYEDSGSSRELTLQALTCYENALTMHSSETEEWHWESLARVRELSAVLRDDHYQYYLDNGLNDILEGEPPEMV